MEKRKVERKFIELKDGEKLKVMRYEGDENWQLDKEGDN